MSLSVFDLFKIGIGPSSSHTVGPMRAAESFLATLQQRQLITASARIQVQLFGSLSSTGVGHATDSATLYGLVGKAPETISAEEQQHILQQAHQHNQLLLAGQHPIEYLHQRDMLFCDTPLPFHANGMTLTAYDQTGDKLYQNTYYSIGGGFVIDQAESEHPAGQQQQTETRYPLDSAAELLAQCERHNLSISNLMMVNETGWQAEAAVKQQLLKIWQVMQQCVSNGLAAEGELPGGLRVKRRAKELHAALNRPQPGNFIASSLRAMDWINLYALAVNEENAAGGRVVTAPTNGAAGIIPAVLHYYHHFCEQADDAGTVRFMLAAAAVGMLCKKNASISGAEVGCQGEVGSACAMAAAGLTEALGGTPAQVEHAAEIGLEHNLGLTCDPVAGLVQVPCIERNAIAAVKAINATQMALRGETSQHIVSLDQVIRTMRDTGADMQSKYKETSQGGLAVNVVAC